MNFPRIVFTGAILLFSMIAFIGIVKKVVYKTTSSRAERRYLKEAGGSHQGPLQSPLVAVKGDFPSIDRIHALFAGSLPIVKILHYKSSVAWLPGRPAWISDYSARYHTSSHFIMRSLSKSKTYQSQLIREGDEIVIFDPAISLHFFCVVDLSNCKLGLYYYDEDHDERVFLKAYSVAVGKARKEGDSTTPQGKYSLGSKVGIYKKGEIGYHLGRKVEMIQVYGTRWIPLEGASGLGIQGNPLIRGKERVENGQVTDGCIKLCREDLEELFAIVTSKPTEVIITKDFKAVQLPGREVAEPTR